MQKYSSPDPVAGFLQRASLDLGFDATTNFTQVRGYLTTWGQTKMLCVQLGACVRLQHFLMRGPLGLSRCERGWATGRSHCT